jgi:hypothetical protein
MLVCGGALGNRRNPLWIHKEPDLGKKDFWKEYTTLNENAVPDLFQWPYVEPEENTPIDLQGP